jgi:SNF2 family DNA or RNA helicase
VAFLWKVAAQGGGGILADDMGLGKTVRGLQPSKGVAAPRQV